jgi:hypothetical protein
MKFDELYNKVFVKEAEAAQPEATEVANPSDFNDVDPIPLPEPTQAAAVPQPSGSLTDYISQCNEFADKLQSAGGNNLQSLVSSLDKPLTPFEGIHSKTSPTIEAAAKVLKELSGKLLSFSIAATKK